MWEHQRNPYCLQVNCWNVYTHSSASLIELRRLVNVYLIIMNWTSYGNHLTNVASLHQELAMAKATQEPGYILNWSCMAAFVAIGNITVCLRYSLKLEWLLRSRRSRLSTYLCTDKVQTRTSVCSCIPYRQDYCGWLWGFNSSLLWGPTYRLL